MSETLAAEPVFGADADLKRAELDRMRLLAGGLLAAMILLFAAASLLLVRWPWIAYPRAFAEAAMIGACADWFAVVALFRHPFGLPIPHTAIVPRHKQRIGEKFGQFLSGNFLSPAQVTERIEKVDAAGWIAGWLKRPENVRLVARRAQGLLPPLLDLLSEEQIRHFSLGVVRGGIDSIAAAPLAARILAVIAANGLHDRLFDKAVLAAGRYVEGHQDAIKLRIAKGSSRWLPEWVDSKLANAFIDEIRGSLSDAITPGHPWRGEFHQEIDRLIHRLGNDPLMLEWGEKIKGEVLDNRVVDGYLDWLRGEAEDRIKTHMAAPQGLLSDGIEHMLVGLGEWLDKDESVRATINHWGRQLVLNSLVPNRAEIGKFVAEVVTRWDSRTLVDKLELQVGRDLQYIRINGTLVGGVIGLLIFVVSRAIG